MDDYSFRKMFYFNYRILMIIAEGTFFRTSNLKGYRFHSNKATLYSISATLSIVFAIHETLFLEIGPVDQML